MADTQEATLNGSSGFVSKLAQGRQRFLAHMIEHALQNGRRSPEDFIRHFPPATIMEGLADKPTLRGQILEHTTGLKNKIAMKKSWSSAAEDLLIALNERETDAASVVAVFAPDDRVRYLDSKKLWAFLTEGEFWNATLAKKEEYSVAKRHLAYLLERALLDELLTHRDVVEGVTVAELAVRLPKAELGKIIQQALASGHGGRPFTEGDLLVAMPPETLVEYIPLAHLFESVVVPKIAEAHGYTEAPDRAPAEVQQTAPAANATPANHSESQSSTEAEGAPQAASPEWEEAGNKGDWMEFDEADSAAAALVSDEITDDDFATV